VDFDTISGQARGTFWSALYSPRANRFDLAVKPSGASDESSTDRAALLSWWGLPGSGIGGMLASGSDLRIIQNGYRYGLELNSLEELPVLQSATKSLLTRWTAAAPARIEAQLVDDDGLVVGSLANQTGLSLGNARLFYGSWAYRLGTLNVGTRIEVGEELSPRKAKTIVTREALGDSGAIAAPVESRMFAAEKASSIEILNLMMFYETAGGFEFAHLPNRFQAYCDLSRQLDLGRAVLVADVTEADTQLVDTATGEAIGDHKHDASKVVYRFLLPVRKKGTP
jgi:hypothetical protein